MLQLMLLPPPVAALDAVAVQQGWTLAVPPGQGASCLAVGDARVAAFFADKAIVNGLQAANVVSNAAVNFCLPSSLSSVSYTHLTLPTILLV